MKSKLKFIKMEGIGNDYIYVDAINQKIDNASELAKRLSDRHFGIGSDGLILISESEIADFKMNIYNTDGSEAEMCGNGIRCVSKFVYDNGLTNKTSLTIETLAGIKKVELILENDKVSLVKVDMGIPILEGKKIPVNYEADSFVKLPLNILGKDITLTCVSMGNPHAVCFDYDIKSLDIEKIGLLIENNEMFPNRVNAEFVNVISKDEIDMRVWERGVGETLACGTGACASVIACILNGYTNKKVVVNLLGGKLEIFWGEDDHVYLTGPATTVFEGVVEI